METALFKKPQHFPKVSYRDLLLFELECSQEEGDIPGLSYLTQKLPFSLQGRWMGYGTHYKKQHTVSFPLFSIFSSFICKEESSRIVLLHLENT